VQRKEKAEDFPTNMQVIRMVEKYKKKQQEEFKKSGSDADKFGK